MATDKQKEYALKLAKQKGIDISNFTDDEYIDFIKKHSFRFSDKQLKIINLNCTDSKILELANKNSGCREDFFTVKNWLDNYFANKPLSDAQKNIVINNAPSDIRELLESNKIEDKKKIKYWIDSFFLNKKKETK